MKKIYLGGKDKLFALVDDGDYLELSKNHWYIGSRGYAVRQVMREGKVIVILMHRVIMNTPEDMDTDHIDRNKLNNQRSNLKICTHQENMLNRGIQKNNKTGYTGIYLAKIKGTKDKYVAQVKRYGKSRHLGRFNTLMEAVKARESYIQEGH